MTLSRDVRPPMPTLVRLIGIAVAAAAIATGCTSLDTWQRKAIFQHETSNRWNDVAAPAEAEEFDLVVAGGEKVHAWYLPAHDAAATMLYLHGARRSLNGSAYRIERLRGLGFNLLAIDYRGFGRSTSRLPSEASAIEDAQAAFAELLRREPDPARRFVYGYSLGGAVAIALAAREGGIAGVVVESTFTSIPELVKKTRWGWVPFIGLAVTQEFDSLGRIAAVDEPLLFIHGTRDGVIPHEMSDELAAAAARAPPRLKRVIKVDGATHRGSPYVDQPTYDAALREFVGAASGHALGTLAGAAAAVP